MTIQEIHGVPDFSELIELIRAEWPTGLRDDSDSEMLRKMNESYNTQTDTVKCLVDDGKIIGFYRYTRWPRDNPSSATAHTMDISVLAGRRRRGLGSLLMADLIDDCANHGIRTLLSRTMKDNAASIAFHKSVGFRRHTETDDAIVWEMAVAGRDGRGDR